MTAIDSDMQARDYAGAIYGSLLAASVVVGAGAGSDVPQPWELATLLVATGIVFWLAHVYAHVVGGPLTPDRTRWENIRHIASREWPMAGAVLPPAATAVLGLVVGLSDSTTGWLALGVAVAGQTGWAATAAVTAGAGRWAVVLFAAVNLALGLIIIVLKALLTH